MTPEELDALAMELHHEWDSPGLWPRISAAAPRRRWIPWAGLLAAAAALLLALYVAPRGPRSRPSPAAPAPLLSEQAFLDVRRAEAAYLQSIDRLSKAALPKLQAPASPLLRAYAEKLTLLDGAIAALRAEMDRNEFNAHLHVQMAALYLDKQRTLEQVLRND